MILITGGYGQLGSEIALCLKAQNIEFLQLGHYDLDITDQQKVNEIFSKFDLKMIFHCAAYTNVDKAELEKKECYEVNVKGTLNLIRYAKEHNSKFIYISTDYVFDGSLMTPYSTDIVPNPINYYGLTKYLAETLIQSMLDDYLIIRVSWLFGLYGNNFVKKIIEIAKLKTSINVVDDQIGSPTYAKDAAKKIIEITQLGLKGVFHVTNSGNCTWAEFAQEIVRISNLECNVLKVKSEQMNYKAQRPKNSILSSSSLTDNGIDLLPNWKDALERFYKEVSYNES